MSETETTAVVRTGDMSAQLQANAERRKQRLEAARNGAESKGGGGGTLNAAIGQGDILRWNGKSYQMAPITFGRRALWVDALNRLHHLVFLAALAAAPPDGGYCDDEEVSRLMTAQEKQAAGEGEEAAEYTADDVQQARAALGIQMPDAMWQALAEAICIPLQRFQPDLKPDDILPDLDLPTGITILRALLQLSGGVRQGFIQP